MAFVFLRMMHDAVNEITDILFKAEKKDVKNTPIDDLVCNILYC